MNRLLHLLEVVRRFFGVTNQCASRLFPLFIVFFGIRQQPHQFGTRLRSSSRHGIDLLPNARHGIEVKFSERACHHHVVGGRKFQNRRPSQFGNIFADSVYFFRAPIPKVHAWCNLAVRTNFIACDSNRRHRKMQKNVYRVCKQEHIHNRIAMDMLRDSQKQGRTTPLKSR
jgi:hypothetical protein